MASRASVSVDWNAATSSCGSSRMNPTVSATTTLRIARQHDAAHRGIERREQLVGDVGIGARERAEQRRLAGVGVADQRERGNRDLGALLAAGLALLFDLLESRGQRLDAFAEQAAVGFELRFAGTAIADAAAALALEVGPAAHQARGDVFELRELHFELAFVAARALREDVEDQPRAIEHAALDELLEIAFLRRRQRMIEQHDVGIVLDGGGADLIRLAAADEEARIGAIAPAANAERPGSRPPSA